MFERNEDITADAVQKLVPELWGKPRIAALLQSWTDEVQELEDAIFGVILSRLLDNATGAQLAALGSIVGQKDFGWDENSYRSAIRARIRANRSDGLMNDVIDVVKLLVPGQSFTITNGPDSATMTLTFLESLLIIRAGLENILKDTRLGGVRLNVRRPYSNNVFTRRAYFATNVPALGYGSAWRLDEDLI